MAGSLVGALRVTLGIDTAAFEEGLGIAQKRLNAAGRKMQEVGDRMASVGSTLSVAVTAPLLAAGAAAVKGAQDQAQAMAQVNAALESMGPVAGRTADQLLKASDALELRSLFDGDEILKKVTANLLTFGNVAGEQFDRAQQAAVDLSTRMGTDLQSSALLVGKALNDPIKGLTALGRAGIQFSADQKALIKSMVETGDAAGAQSIILGELEKQFGGAAQAAADTSPWRKAEVAFGQAGDKIGEALLPAIAKVSDFAARLATAFTNLSPETQALILGFAGVAAVVGPVLVVLGTLVSSIGALIPVFAPLVALVGGAGLGAAFTALVAAIAPFIAPIAAVAAIGALIYANWDKIGPVIEEFRAKVFGALGPKLQSLIETVQTTLTKLWNGPFGDAIRVVIGVLGEMQAAYLSVLGEVIIRIVSALISFLETQFNVIGDIFNVVIALLSGDFAGAWEAMKSLVSNVITGVINILNSLAPGAGAAVAEMAAGFRQWFADLATTMVTYGRAIIDGLVFGINAAPQAVWNALRNVVLSGVNNVREMLGIASPSKLFISFGGFVTEGLAIGITGGLPKVGAAMDKLGSTVADGLAALPAGRGISIDPGADVGAAGEDASSALRDTFRQTFADGIKAALSGDLGSFLDQTFNSIFDNVLRNFSDGLAGALSGLLGGGGGGGGLGDLFGSVFGSIFGGAPGFALGGNFKVGGRPGRDANLVAFRATRGETVQVSTRDAAQANGGGMALGISAAPVVNITNTIDASGADPAAIARLNSKLDQMNAELPGKIVRTVQDASNRRMIKVGGS